jgi:hypothetical protein
MTTLEIIFLIIIWIFVGSFICYKRNWYKAWESYDTSANFICIVTIVLTPASLLIALFREFVLDKWNNDIKI